MPAFYERFEDRILFYDCFWFAGNQSVLLVGPPPLNLHAAFMEGQFFAQPSGQRLFPAFHTSLSTMITALRQVPDGTTEIEFVLSGHNVTLPVQPNLAAQLSGRRVLFTMSKDNDIIWIKDWAQYYAQRHATDTVILFDNGSSKYSPEDLGQALGQVEGLSDVIILSWPFVYGAIDNAVLFNPYWTQFLQVSAMSLVLRRFASNAIGIVNADIDELVQAPLQETIYDIVNYSSHGLVSMLGKWVEPVVDVMPDRPLRHADFVYRKRDPKQQICKACKWAISPTREWFGNLDIHPYMHWIENRPRGAKTMRKDVFFWHYKGINTNWKVTRANISHDGFQVERIDE